MSVLHEAEEERVEKPRNTVVWIAWNILFALFYPVLAAFSIIIMVVMFISSSLSNFFFWLIHLFKKRS